MYQVVAFYHFVKIENPSRDVKEWHKYLKDADVKGRVYLSKEGINAQMSMPDSEIEPFTNWLTAKYAGDFDIKLQPYKEHAFAKMTVKEREELAVLKAPVDLDKRGNHVSPATWKKMLDEKDDDTIVLDVRNDYEWKVGRFSYAEDPKLETFKEFPEYADNIAKTYDPKKTKVMMYCTGGIRCELFSPLLKERGFENIYQLDGGVIKYGNEVGTDHFEGNLFVFDDRLVAPITDEKNPPIAKCYKCDTKTDTYYNCANMDCNDLFLSCPSCVEKMKGCCKSACLESARRREFVPTENPKPYRKLRK